MVAENATELRCAVVYRLNHDPQQRPTILACFDEFHKYARAGAKVIRKFPPGKAPETEDVTVAGFRVVQSADHHQLVYGVDKYGICKYP